MYLWAASKNNSKIHQEYKVKIFFVCYSWRNHCIDNVRPCWEIGNNNRPDEFFMILRNALKMKFLVPRILIKHFCVCVYLVWPILYRMGKDNWNWQKMKKKNEIKYNNKQLAKLPDAFRPMHFEWHWEQKFQQTNPLRCRKLFRIHSKNILGFGQVLLQLH